MLLLFPAWLLLFLLILPLLEGCGRAKDELDDYIFQEINRKVNRPDRFIDPDLQPFMDEYVRDMSDRGIDTDISNLYRLEYADVLEIEEKGEVRKLLGVCYHNRDPKGYYGTIKILRGHGEEVTRAIVYHELGHCVHDLDHSDKPNTLMFPSLTTNPQFYVDNWTQLVDEMVEYIKQQRGDLEHDAA